jgi:Uma2 family endonuclease
MSLAEFLEWDRIDEKPYLEYLEGRIEVKVSPRALHSLIELRMLEALNRVAEPERRGVAFPELRCTFANRSIVPDVVFLLEDHIRVDANGDIVEEILAPPDVHIEIRSPKKSHRSSRDKLEHATANGCPLGWSIDPYNDAIEVYRPGRPVERLGAEGVLDGSPVLPGFRLSVGEVLGWRKFPKPGSNPS